MNARAPVLLVVMAAFSRVEGRPAKRACLSPRRAFGQGPRSLEGRYQALGCASVSAVRLHGSAGTNSRDWPFGAAANNQEYERRMSSVKALHTIHARHGQRNRPSSSGPAETAEHIAELLPARTFYSPASFSPDGNQVGFTWRAAIIYCFPKGHDSESFRRDQNEIFE